MDGAAVLEALGVNLRLAFLVPRVQSWLGAHITLPSASSVCLRLWLPSRSLMRSHQRRPFGHGR